MASNYTDSFAGDPYYILKGEQLSAAGMTAALNTKEKVANKVTTINNQSTDTQYPSAKVVYDTLNGTNNDIVHKAGAETITGVKTFGTASAAAEPLLGVAKTTAAANDGKKIATEAQVYDKQDKIPAGTTKNIVAYSGTAGTFGTLTRATAINAQKDERSDDKIPTEKAVAAYVADIILPIGTILAMESMAYYNNADAAFKTKWKVCDGSNNTPDLKHKFLRGFQPGDTTIAGDGKKTLSITEMPSHSHRHTHLPHSNHYGETEGMDDNSHTPNGVFSVGDYTSSTSGGSRGTWLKMDAGHDNNHSYDETTAGGGQAFDVLPAFYTVIYIMKIA
ncbi:MAG: hypothetical protein LBK68_06570 [Candidatus Margulisbacteria bacterium]|jgi:hypothetical protein|nr:hypothetical protein [Candidatus Margulisiibacteriota bacterium]